MLIYTHHTFTYTHTLAHMHTHTHRHKYGMHSYVYAHLWSTFIVHTFMHMHTHTACSYMRTFAVHLYTGACTYPASCEHECHPANVPVFSKLCLLISLAVFGAIIPVP